MRLIKYSFLAMRKKLHKKSQLEMYDFIFSAVCKSFKYNIASAALAKYLWGQLSSSKILKWCTISQRSIK